MNWLNKINALFLVVVLIAPIVYVTIATLNNADNISSLIITSTEEEEEDKDGEEENDIIKSFPIPSISSPTNNNPISFSFIIKGFKLQNRSGDVFSPPPDLV